MVAYNGLWTSLVPIVLFVLVRNMLDVLQLSLHVYGSEDRNVRA